MITLEARWDDVIGRVDGPSIAALVNVLDRRGHLDGVKDEVFARAVDELRTDVPSAGHEGKLGRALELIEAGADKATVVSSTSRRTYFRARRQCQSAK
jgi:hypothetical protein